MFPPISAEYDQWSSLKPKQPFRNPLFQSTVNLIGTNSVCSNYIVRVVFGVTVFHQVFNPNAFIQPQDEIRKYVNLQDSFLK